MLVKLQCFCFCVDGGRCWTIHRDRFHQSFCIVWSNLHETVDICTHGKILCVARVFLQKMILHEKTSSSEDFRASISQELLQMLTSFESIDFRANQSTASLSDWNAFCAVRVLKPLRKDLQSMLSSKLSRKPKTGLRLSSVTDFNKCVFISKV